MASENILHMTAGTGEFSYASNSILQKMIMQKARPILEDTVKDMYNNEEFQEYFRVADLGCSSGPNTLLVTYNIIDTIHGLCREKNREPPEFQISLNDLPGNDFNAIFKSLPEFYDKLKKEKGAEFGACFVSGVPGSFYARLFQSKSLHFVHSSTSIHWLSQVPENLENNKSNICMSKSSPPDVFEAYLKQFQRDFSTFLRLRSEEIMPRGRMVLTFLGRSSVDPVTELDSSVWDLLAKSLEDMVAEGLVKEGDLDSFNLPFYVPYKNEVKAIIQNEGSFRLDRLHVFEVMNWESPDVDDKQFVLDKYNNGKVIAKTTRAIAEPMLASHFGNSIIDNLFERYAKHVVEHLDIENTKTFNIVISLTKKY